MHSGPGGLRVSRRTAITGIAALLGGAAGSGTTYAAIGSSGPAAGASTPGEDLMTDHGVLKRVLLVYRELSRRAHGDEVVPAAVLNGAASLIHSYIEDFHEALEETYIFPTLVRASTERDLVPVLLAQHAAGRLITQSLLTVSSSSQLSRDQRGQVATHLDAFVRMYEPHEAREDTVAFPAYRAITSDGDLARLAERFSALETRQLGARGLADAIGRITVLEQKLGIADLSEFTPTTT
jgi:hemerythrin-like domain-containing protein